MFNMNFSLKDLIKENLKLFEGRKEDAQAKYTDVPEKIFNIFVEEDPSGNYKYLDWVMKFWQEDMCYGGGWRCGNDSVATNLMIDISYFSEYPHKYEIKDINDFQSLKHFSSITMESRLKMTKGELKKQSTKHYETDKYLIVEPHSHSSSCFYGSGTQWCTTTKDSSSYFDEYYSTNSLLYFINKKTGKKRAFLTPLGRPMFGPRQYGDSNWLYVGEKEYKDYRGQIYTETDNLGRSLRGIPIEAREAMQEAHKEKAKRWVKNLKDGERKYKLMLKLGMEDEVPKMTTVDNWNDNGSNKIPDTVVNVTNTFSIVENSFGNVKTVSRLDLGCNAGGCANKVDSIQTVGDKLTITGGMYHSQGVNSVDLGSLTGHIPIIVIRENALISSWGSVTSVGELQSHMMDEDFLELINDIPINNIALSQKASEKMLKLFWIKKRNPNVEIRRYLS